MELKTQLIVELAPGGRELLRAGLLEPGGAYHPIDIAELSGVSAGGDRVVAILSGVDVAFTHLQMPDLPAAKLEKILPGMMADRVATGGDGLHYAVPEGGGAPGTRPVAVVDRRVVDDALAVCRAHGVDPAFMTADFLLLAQPESGAVMARTGDLIAVRCADGTGFTAETALADAMLKDVPSHEIRYVSYPEQILAGLVRPAEGGGLLQGSYARRAGTGQLYLWFRRSIALAAALLLAFLGTGYFEASRSNGAADMFDTAARTAFTEAFPTVTRVVNMEVQARREIERRRQGEGGEFLAITGRIFAAIEARDGALLEGMRFDGETGELALTLSLTSYAEIEQLKTDMEQARLTVSEGGSRQEAGRIFTDLTVRRQS